MRSIRHPLFHKENTVVPPSGGHYASTTPSGERGLKSHPSFRGDKGSGSLGIREWADNRERESPSAELPRGQFQYLNLKCGLPASAMPKEGYRKWGDTPVTEKIIHRAEELIRLGAPNAAAHLSLYRAFTRWRGAYLELTSLAESLIIFAAYLDNTGLRKSTCAEYVRTAKKMALHSGEKFGDPSGALERALKGLDLLAAMEKPEHALDISAERLAEILNTVQKEEARFEIWLMAHCGARSADLLRLSSCQIKYNDGKLTILYRVTKTDREPGCAHQVTYEVTGFENQWREFLQRATPCTLDADSLNKVLHAAGFEETTYSFRRFFVQNTIERFTQDGHTDWCRVIELTNHQKVSTVRGHYQHHIDDADRDAHAKEKTILKEKTSKKRSRKVPDTPSLELSKPKLVQQTLKAMFKSKTLF